MPTETLRYTDENDRAYGLTGMAIAIVIKDSREYLDHIDLDAPADEMMQFTPQYYFAGNPRLSARLAWNQLVSNFTLNTAIILSDILCRHTLYRNTIPADDDLRHLLETLTGEGLDTCSLEPDEVNAIFNQHLRYFTRIYRHSGVASIARDFARQLISQRHMSAHETLEALRPLAYL